MRRKNGQMKWYCVVKPDTSRIVQGVVYDRQGKLKWKAHIRFPPWTVCQDCGTYAATYKPDSDTALCNYCADRPYHIDADPYDPLRVRVIKDGKIVKEYRISNEEYQLKINKGYFGK